MASLSAFHRIDALFKTDHSIFASQLDIRFQSSKQNQSKHWVFYIVCPVAALSHNIVTINVNWNLAVKSSLRSKQFIIGIGLGQIAPALCSHIVPQFGGRFLPRVLGWLNGFQDGLVTVDEFKGAVKKTCLGKTYAEFPQAMKVFIDSHFKSIDINGT